VSTFDKNRSGVLNAVFSRACGVLSVMVSAAIFTDGFYVGSTAM
jgi:hypothetical protein